MSESPESPDFQSDKSSGAKTGCMIVGTGCLILLLIGIGLAIYLALNWKEYVTEIGRRTFDAVVEDSQLPEDQKVKIKETIDRVADDYKKERIDEKQIEAIFREARPLLTAVIGLAAVQKYIAPSRLSDEEKAAGELAVRRLIHGVFDGSVPDSAIDELQELIAPTGSSGRVNAKEKMTDDEVREVIAKAKQAADDAGVPAEVPPPDIAGELERAVDRAYQK
ncbi:MAG: hypothetical protein KDC38_02370 [Planctomycetes bacterium]|nr:hypothetical protein [Planctomycetota bacterium]